MKVINKLELLFVLLFLTPSQIQAQVIINEVFPAPKQGNEWIELYNPSNQAVDLNNWLLLDQLSSPSIIAVINDQTLPPQDFFVIELSSAKLNNSADGVTLKNSQAEIIDQMDYLNSEPGLSWSRTNNDIFKLTQPTKNTSNLFPSPSPSPMPSSSPTPSPTPSPSPPDTSFHQFILITEFSACPTTGEKEWIKIHNLDNHPHSLSGWKIRDISNQTRPLEVTLAAEEQQLISWSGSLLNNSGDEFSLENELGESWQSIKYDACQANTSFINVDQNWIETPAITQNTAETNNQTGNSNASPNDNNTATLLTLPTPPRPPFPPSSAKLPIVSYDSENYAHKNKFTKLIAKKPPKEALLSVILGGSWLLFSSSWKIHEKIWRARSPA